MSAVVKAEGMGLSPGNSSRKHRSAQACGEEEVEMEMGALGSKCLVQNTLM